MARGFIDPSEALEASGRVDDADRVLEIGLRAFPGNADLLLAHAFVAGRTGRPSVALVRWASAHAVVPERPTVHTGLASSLRHVGDTARAQEVIAAALDRFPVDPTVLAEAARIAEERGEFERALEIWRTICATPAPPPEWLQRQANILVLTGRFDAAEEVLDTALAPYRSDAELTAERARGLLAVRGFLATSRDNARLDGTLDRSEAVGQPEHPRIRAPLDVGFVENAAANSLLLEFESIGQSCEFGLVQRRFGAEPLSLFRWNEVQCEDLIAGLDDGLAGLGDPAQTVLWTDHNGGFVVGDRRWGFGMQTWTFAGRVERDVLLAKMCRRIAFLKDKFMADLAGAEKILVFAAPALGTDRLHSLHAALRAHGPVTLLVAQPMLEAGAVSGAAGDVVQVADGLFVGFVARLGGDRDVDSWDIAFDDWITICEKTRAARGRVRSP